MKFSLAGPVLAVIAGPALALIAGLAPLPAPAQTSNPAPATAPVQAPAEAPAQAMPPATSSGKVIFSRSTDESGQTTTEAGPGAPPRAPQMVAAPTAEDAERAAITFTDLDLDVHLRPAEKHLAVRALLSVRNDGNTPLGRIPLQISSTLNWERIRVHQKDVAFQVARLNSDTDHTGQLNEAAVPLSEPLAPGTTVQLDVTYSGPIPASAQRLLAIGTPDDVALHSDWDQIGVDFTGLRGFGNVVWYPVSSVPAILGDGAHLFDQIGEHKLHLAGARFRLRLAVEILHGRVPNVALVNGLPVALRVTPGTAALPVDDAPAAGSSSAAELGKDQAPGEQPGPDGEVAGVATADTGNQTLGFDAPSLFVAIRTARSAPNTALWVRPEDEASALAWATAVKTVTPFLQGWLGETPRAPLTLLDLPDPQDTPFETGALLATSIGASATPANQDQLEGILAHALTHAWMQSPRAWISEGAAHFLGTLWVEKQRGRDQALGALEAAREALALAEPESPGQSPGQPLAQAVSPVYYRTKAAYVFWMLRSVAGDSAVSAALRAYDPKADESPGYGKDTAPSNVQKLLEQEGARADLAWFFADWVNNDKGLPDLGIESVFPTAQAAGNWLVTVNLVNHGYAAAEVPVTVRSYSNSVTQRVVVPGRGKVSPRLLVLGKPTQVQVNDGAVPETQATVHITRLTDDPGETQAPSAQPPEAGPGS